MPDSLTLVSYNILEGLRPVSPALSERRGIDRERAEAARTVVGEINPDFLVLNEALFCRQHADRMVDYGQLLEFPYQTAALYDGAWGNAILSRYPIMKSAEMRIYNRGGLVAIIETPAGRLSIASYHPHPRRYPENKASDFTRLVAGLDGPLIVCGDLNCISPEDRIDRRQLIDAFQKISPDPERSVDQFIDSGEFVFKALGELGLTDAVPLGGRRYSIPTDLIDLDKRSAMRIDHILANDAIEVVTGEVAHSPASNRASDHHPVMLKFRMRST